MIGPDLSLLRESAGSMLGKLGGTEGMWAQKETDQDQ